MNKEQQELYEKLLKKVNEYCLGYAAEDVIEAIDALVDNYEIGEVKMTEALEIIKEHRLDIDWFLQFVKQDISYQHYVYCVEQSNNAFAKRFLLNDKEYELLKEILL